MTCLLIKTTYYLSFIHLYKILTRSITVFRRSE